MYGPIFARPAIRANVLRRIALEPLTKRGFATSKIMRSDGHGHHPEGPYHNLPFKVHNRKIPFIIPFSLFFIIPFLTPFGMAALAM
ncbi:hypothetical protein V1512DRAFT_264675 [Lipomyces arxii]|uniref:uncharacterized protein n=1 Tax=Lipomyces arxii TaxID=56418 RepID=UPI0034CD9A12